MLYAVVCRYNYYCQKIHCYCLSQCITYEINKENEFKSKFIMDLINSFDFIVNRRYYNIYDLIFALFNFLQYI